MDGGAQTDGGGGGAPLCGRVVALDVNRLLQSAEEPQLNTKKHFSFHFMETYKHKSTDGQTGQAVKCHLLSGRL